MKRKQGFGMWLSLIAIIASVVAFVMYKQALVDGNMLIIASGSEFFYDPNAAYYATMVETVAPYTVVGVALLALAILLGQIQNGYFGILTSCIRVVAPAVLMVAFLQFLYGSFTGLGWTYFSNAELEIYEEALAVGQNVIIALGCFAGAAFISMFAAFFKISKKVAIKEKKAKKEAK